MSKIYVQQALDLLGSGLDRYIQAKMAPLLGSLDWTSVLQELDRMRGKADWIYSRQDPALQLRMLTERLGSFGYPFDEGDRNRTLSSYGSVLRIVRNRLFHGAEFEAFDALHAVDTMRTVLAHIGDSDRAAQVADIRTALMSQLVAEPDGMGQYQPDTAPEHPEENQLEPSTAPEPLYGESPWQPWMTVVVGEQEDLDSMRTNRVKENVRGLIEDIAEAEGPVHQERVARLVGLAFGFSRLAPARVTRILRQIPKASVVLDADGFVWPGDIDRDRWVIHRTSDETQRPIEHISPVEIANAAMAILKGETSLDDTELRRRVLLQFGRKRNSKAASRQLDLGLAYGRDHGRIH